MRTVSLTLVLLSLVPLAAAAQEAAEPSDAAETTVPAAAAEGTAPVPPVAALGVGSQAEFISTGSGLGALVVEYDAGGLQASVNLGIAFLENEPDVYVGSVRFSVILARGSRADFGIAGGAGLAFVDRSATAPEGDELSLTMTAGARIRIWLAPNVATSGTFGVGGILRDGGSAFLIGARPLGSAGFVYYFR